MEYTKDDWEIELKHRIFGTKIILHNFLINWRGASVCLWILNIFQIFCAFVEIYLTDQGIVMSQAFYELSAINLGIGGGTIIARFIIGMYMVYLYDEGNMKVDNKGELILV